AIGVDSTMLVLNKKSGDPSVKVLPNDYSSGITNCLDVSVYYSPVWNKQVVRWQKLMLEYPNRPAGLETFTDAVSDVRLDRVREIQDADIINLHWVAGCMDCLSVPLAIGNKPIVWTLHDMNPFTGGCHYAGDCLKYKVSCGACPQLGSDIDDDLSRQVWRQKFDAYKSLNINIVTPSQWLGKCASESKLFSRFPVNVIPNGLPTNIFKPYPKTKIRKAVNIPESAKIILFGADSVVNERKGFRYLLEALNKLPLKGKRDNIILAFFGHLPEGTKIDSMYPMLNFGSITDENQLAMAYSAADVFVLPSLEDNLPNTVIEAMACGVSVVGFDIGGIPDMIEHKKTGYLVKPKDIYDLIEGIGWAMSSERSFRLSEQCRAKVEKEYTLEVQAKAYSELYERILKDHSRIGKDIFTQAKILNQQGEDLFAKGDLKGALYAFTKALDIAPNYAETHNNLGVVYWQSGIQKALQYFAKALEIDPNDRDAVLNLGDIFKALGEVNKARVVYLSYLSKNPEDEGVTLAWGELKDKEEDKAIVEIRKAEAKDYLVSAIVSTYCSEEFMRECLENVEDQTISDKLEIVVVDAASPQNEGQIVKEFQKRYANITYIRTKGRIGIYTAWNIAIKASSGKYCISVSTNDHLKREACEVLARALDDNPKCALVYGNTYLTHNPHETFEKNTHFRTYQWPEYRFEDLLQNCMVGPHPMWRKSVHDHIGYFDERYVADGDQEFWLRIGEKYPLLHIPEFIGLQWITINSLSGKGDIPRLEVAHIHAIYQRRYNTADRTMKCSIIIPVFNQVEYTKKCLEALIENTPDGLYEVIIVDNGSTDGTKEFLKCLEGDVKIITNQENLGFAKACNQGARKASGKYLVFLNNDTIPQRGWLDELVRVAGADKDIAVVGSKLLFPDGTIQNAGLAIADSKLLSRHIYRGYPSDFPPANKPRDFQVVTGACMLVKKDIFFDVGGFDEAFVNGCEDIDLCFKVRESGKRVFYNPRSVLTLFEGKTEGKQNKMDDNAKILFERWGDRVKPDYEKYLIEDGFRIEETPGGEKKWVYHEELFKPVLSIVIVTCNSLGYIENCLDSIRTQITIPYEVIIIDNNSSDGTRDFLKGLENVKVILNNENKGFSKATNQGIKLVRGEYVVFLNPDTAVTWDICMVRDVLHFNEGVGAVGHDLYPTMQQTCRDTNY
ncbi:MAG: glycosyltransferase, partial [Deltaproteobacteria bacterium]|nr:glycosyltransferase [Deltaproteobacteria bacterium]